MVHIQTVLHKNSKLELVTTALLSIVIHHNQLVNQQINKCKIHILCITQYGVQQHGVVRCLQHRTVTVRTYKRTHTHEQVERSFSRTYTDTVKCHYTSTIQQSEQYILLNKRERECGIVYHWSICHTTIVVYYDHHPLPHIVWVYCIESYRQAPRNTLTIHTYMYVFFNGTRIHRNPCVCLEFFYFFFKFLFSLF